MASTHDTLHDLFVAGARNLHAVEKQALSIMTPQVTRLEHYPEVAERLRLHIDETHRQIERLDRILAKEGSGASAIKDLGLSLSGGMAAMAHTVAGDEILKNGFTNYAFEHFEIAGYVSLMTFAEDARIADATALLQQSLDEERRMAEWIGEALPLITRRYADLYAQDGSSAAKV